MSSFCVRYITIDWVAEPEMLAIGGSRGGRTLTQGALAWIWGRSKRPIPIPGFRTPAQVEENCSAMAFGPLGPAHMQEIDALLERWLVT
jgi:aryl-alcohol dehydrogenase-like predicted oxidoreductase